MPQNGLTRVSATAGEHLARPRSLPSETSRRWLWYGFGMALVWLWCGFGVALRWPWDGFVLRSLCLVYAYYMALRWLWVALPRLSRLDVGCSTFDAGCSGPRNLPVSRRPAGDKEDGRGQ